MALQQLPKQMKYTYTLAETNRQKNGGKHWERPLTCRGLVMANDDDIKVQTGFEVIWWMSENMVSTAWL